VNSSPYADIDAGQRRRVGWLLAAWAAMVVVIVVIGGITRLTESGLSITEWAPVTGTIPPLSQRAWTEAFEAYQRIPEYQQLNRGMTLGEFKTIYFWEYVHRLWARLIGLVIAVIFVYFLVRGGLSRQLNWRLATLLLLTAGQGALGWFMVMSGLADRIDVSQYRLAAHLALALIIYLLAVWTAADLLWSDVPARESSPNPAFQRAVGWITIFVFITAMAGSFVAGLDGGRVFNTFPLMDGRWVPGGYFSLTPWWKNVFENVIAVQFNHRWMAVGTLGAIAYVWLRGRSLHLGPVARRWLHSLPIAGLFQVVLGIGTLILVVPVWLAALHQAGAVLLLTASLLLYHSQVRTAQ
jgi:cytochrome c oxidase assembly protein subunit 15